MTTDIDAFKSTVTGGAGLAMANMFLVQLPVSIPGIPNINSRTLNILCKSVQFPGRQVTSTEKIIGPKAVKHAYGVLEDDVTMNFQVLNDYKIKNYFEAWQNLVIDENTRELNYFNEYTRDVKIFQLRKRSGGAVKVGTALAVADLIFELFGSNLLNNNQVADLLSSSDRVYGCRLENAFPTTMNAIELNNEQNGLVELNVQLSYKTWSEI